MTSTSYATPIDLEDRWKDLTDAETRRACVLLEDASQKLRDRFGDLEARLAAGDLSADTLRRIVCAMVQRAMLPGATAGAGVSAQTEAVGPFQVQRTYSNPLGNLYISADELAELEPIVSNGGPRAYAVNLDPDSGRDLRFGGLWR
jgi:hypothetical protein